MITKVSSATAESNHFVYTSAPELASSIFAFSFERIALPVLRLVVSSDNLPIELHQFGEEDSFKSRSRAAEHYKFSELNSSPGRAQPCVQCLEHIAGFRPVFDWRPVIMAMLKGILKIMITTILGIWSLVYALGFFCVAIWLVPPNITPQQKRQLEAERERREKEAQEAEERAQKDRDHKAGEEKTADHKFESSKERNRKLVEQLNDRVNEFDYADMNAVKHDDKLVDEANHLGKEAANARTPEARDSAIEERYRVLRELEQQREREAEKYRKRAQARHEANGLLNSYSALERALALAENQGDYEKIEKIHAELNELYARIKAKLFEMDANT